jgi:hypothetical protein
MSRLSGIIGSGILAAVAFAFVFWWINNIHQINGVGLLRRQDWPINSPWFWAAVGFAVGSFGNAVRALHLADHARKCRELAETLGREYAESYSLPTEAQPMPVFEGWSNGRNAMTGREGGVPVTVFDYTTITEGGDSNTVTDGTIALLPADGLPAFDLRPRTFGRRILGWAGFQGLTFDPVAGDPADAYTIQRFSELFYLAPVDPVTMMRDMAEQTPKESDGRVHPPPLMGRLTAMGEMMENRPPEWAGREEAVRRLFTPAMMDAINQYPEYAIQSRHGFLAVWRGSGVLPAAKRTELYDATVELRALLTRPPQSGAGKVIPGRAGTDTSRQLRRVQNTLIGTGVGAFVGFVLSAMAISVVFFRQVPRQQGPGLGFFIQPLLFFGLTFGGAAVGAAIASRLPVRSLPPELAEDPARRKARQRATGLAILIGFVTGFFAGFAVFVASKILLDWKLVFGVEAALFFGSMFGGAVLGAVTCGATVNWWYRRRQRRVGGIRTAS